MEKHREVNLYVIVKKDLVNENDKELSSKEMGQKFAFLKGSIGSFKDNIKEYSKDVRERDNCLLYRFTGHSFVRDPDATEQWQCSDGYWEEKGDEICLFPYQYGQPVLVDFSYEKKGDILSFNIKEDIYNMFLTKQNILLVSKEVYCGRMSVNLTTRFAYMFRSTFARRGKILETQMASRIINITNYGADERRMSLPNSVMDFFMEAEKFPQVYPKMGEAFMEYLGINLNDFRFDGGDLKNTVLKALFHYRYPFFHLNRAETISFLGYGMKKVLRGYRPGMNPKETMQLFAENVGVKNTKMFRRRASDIGYLDILYLLHRCGFHNPDILYRTADAFYKKAREIIERRLYTSLEIEEKQVRRFIRKIVRVRGESSASNFLLKSAMEGSILTDTSHMYYDWTWDTENAIKKISLKKIDILDLHDKLLQMRNNGRTVWQEIPYKQQEKILLEKEEADGVRFLLPTSTKDLYVAGNNMNICVGQPFYADRAAEKEIDLVLVKDKDEPDRYVGCIELNKSKDPAYPFRLEQAKGRFNKAFYGKFAKALKSWVDQAGIDVTGNYDYEIAMESMELDAAPEVNLFARPAG